MTVSEMVTLVPLITLAASAAVYVVNLWIARLDKQRDRFFDLMRLIDGQGSIALKVAAIYELRRFPKHKDFIIRFCDDQSKNVVGQGGSTLISEMNKTKEYFASQ